MYDDKSELSMAGSGGAGDTRTRGTEYRDV